MTQPSAFYSLVEPQIAAPDPVSGSNVPPENVHIYQVGVTIDGATATQMMNDFGLPANGTYKVWLFDQTDTTRNGPHRLVAGPALESLPNPVTLANFGHLVIMPVVVHANGPVGPNVWTVTSSDGATAELTRPKAEPVVHRVDFLADTDVPDIEVFRTGFLDPVHGFFPNGRATAYFTNQTTNPDNDNTFWTYQYGDPSTLTQTENLAQPNNEGHFVVVGNNADGNGPFLYVIGKVADQYVLIPLTDPIHWATKAYVDNAVGGITLPDVSNYATHTDVSDAVTAGVTEAKAYADSVVPSSGDPTPVAPTSVGATTPVVANNGDPYFLIPCDVVSTGIYSNAMNGDAAFGGLEGVSVYKIRFANPGPGKYAVVEFGIIQSPDSPFTGPVIWLGDNNHATQPNPNLNTTTRYRCLVRGTDTEYPAVDLGTI